uniref:Arginine/serine-rich splicing factor SCL28 transcript III n=1 Tax=Sorghum bicolor TaxID=4558 RepID=M1HAI2_SORBI|nr:arginine/serine-rich splicing factor SCL28 transcript III [Sorghum bicolor]
MAGYRSRSPSGSYSPRRRYSRSPPRRSPVSSSATSPSQPGQKIFVFHLSNSVL